MPMRPPIHRPHPPARNQTVSYNDRRGSAHSRGYDSKWRALRQRHLCDNPLCVFCLAEGRTTAGEVVDHIVRHKGNKKLMYDPNNLQTLCKFHHDSTKQAIERQEERKTKQERLPCLDRWGRLKV